jgi:hypothetical protein
MGILSQFLASVKLARQVATTRICPGCQQSFAGKGYPFLGRVWCERLCVPAVLRQADRFTSMEQRSRDAGCGA